MLLGNNSHLSYDQKETCTICLCPFDDPRIIECAHVFCFPCLTQHIEHSRQDHGRSFKCPICRHEFQIQDQSLTSDQIANRFPQKIIRKRIQSSRLLDTKTERNNISNKHDFSKPNFHQPKLNNHNVIPKIPRAPCNTTGLREIRVERPMDMNSSIVNRNPLHVPVINRRFLEPGQFPSMDFHLPNIYSPNAVPEMNRRFLDPVERYPMDFSLEIDSNSPTTTREINRPFLEPIVLRQTNFYLQNITIRNEIPYPRQKYSKPEVRRNNGVLGTLPRQVQSLTQAPRYVLTVTVTCYLIYM